MFAFLYTCEMSVGMKPQRGPGEDQGSEKGQEGNGTYLNENGKEGLGVVCAHSPSRGLNGGERG